MQHESLKSGFWLRTMKVTPEKHVAKVPCDLGRERQHLWPRQRQIEIPGSHRVTHCLAIPWNVEAILGLALRQHLGSHKSIWTERERSETDREESWGVCLTILLGRRWPRDNGLYFPSATMCLTWCTEVVLLQADALVAWSIPCPAYPHTGVFMCQAS